MTTSGGWSIHIVYTYVIHPPSEHWVIVVDNSTILERILIHTALYGQFNGSHSNNNSVAVYLYI